MGDAFFDFKEKKIVFFYFFRLTGESWKFAGYFQNKYERY
jgi:hypothetical protein